MKHLAVSGVLNFLPWLELLPFFRSPRGWIVAGQRRTHSEYQRIIDHVGNEEKEGDDEEGGFTNMTEAFLAVRQEDGLVGREHFTDRQLHFLQADLFGAGSDTAAVTIKWCVLYLCKHPLRQVSQARKEEEGGE